MKSFSKKLLTTLAVKPWPYPIVTPGRTDIKIIKDVHLEPNESYRSKVGSLNCLTMGLRYDLVYTTKELSRVLCAPTKEANTILQRALQYVEQTQDAELTFDRKLMMLFRSENTKEAH